MIERLDTFMARANAAYYAQRDPFADFTTAPEISQVFGELLGLWAAVVWQSMGSPPRVLLAEAGPGRGTMMQDALRAIHRMAPDFRAALQLHLIESSPGLRAVQREKLPIARWHDRLSDLPDGPMILLANEFLDALPIRQFIRAGSWMERHVADGAFVNQPCCEALPDAPEGTVLERCEQALAIAAWLGARLASQGGAALFIDYGPAESAPGDSLQALYGGKPADPLLAAGEADLTAHVDFQAFARASGLPAHGPVPQGIFLARLGLHQRTGMLARTLPPAGAARMLATAQRLAEPDQMGRLFKALALCHRGLPPPPGFARMTPEALTADCIALRHGFFTRRGGVSQGPFASLNCSLSGADDRSAVLENRARIARSLGAMPDAMVGLFQVHGDVTATVTDPWRVGEGPKADAMVTDRAGVTLGIVTADCAPVLFADATAGVIGAAHAGWRGAVGGILESTIAAMRELGATQISAAVGPCIRQPSYEVGADLRDAVLADAAENARFFYNGVRADRWQFDLAGYCAARLRQAGAAIVEIIDADTLPDTDRFFSHRRRTLAGGGAIGHQMSAIVL